MSLSLKTIFKAPMTVNRLNSRQRQILSAWRTLLGRFIGEEWRRAAYGYSFGALVGVAVALIRENAEAVKRLILQTPTVESAKTATSNYGKLAGSNGVYATYLWFAAAPILIVVLIALAQRGRLTIKSWIHGVASGSFWLSFAMALVFSFRVSSAPISHAFTGLALACVVLLVGFGLRLVGAVRRENTLVPDFTVLQPNRRVSYSARDPESPIDSIDEDKLARAAFIEMLARRILVSKDPVIALRGNFGDGKSSVLNLLRQQLQDTAIVVSFATWLPDSQKTLVTDLLGDIATEINKQFLIPGLRRRLDRFASLFAGHVSYLKILVAVIPPYTQREEIGDLEDLLSRIPKRVVVLLDEIDRMQKDEVLILLKLLRGSSSLPNITFVCAFHQEQVEKIVWGAFDSDSHEYMEKFFPTGVDLPKPNPDVLFGMLSGELPERLETAGWLVDADIRGGIEKDLQRLWGAGLDRDCSNIRKIGLMLNDVHAVASLVKNEVNAVDSLRHRSRQTVPSKSL